MRRLLVPWLAALAVMCAPALATERLSIAAAANLKFAMDEIVADFRERHPGARIEVIYGSSGRFHTQLRQGAPFDLFFSADMSFPQLLEEHGLAAGPARPYAVGRIALWSTRMDASAMSLDDLTADGVRRIAIGNPRHAPYGVRAEQVLRAAGAWDAVQDKLVLGSNIAQAVHFVQTGNADVGIVALSLLKNPNLAEAGAHHLIDDALHEPLEQGFIITRRGADKPLAEAFASHMESSLAQEILRRYGFARPGPAGDGEG